MDYDKLHKPPAVGKPVIDREYSEAALEEAEKARDFLCKISPKSNVSLYDHLKEVIARVIRLKIDDAVDVLEEISKEIKKEKYKGSGESEFSGDEDLDKYNSALTEFLESISALRRDSNPKIKGPEDDETEILPLNTEEAQTEEEQPKPWVPEEIQDINMHMFRFRQNGVGLGLEEAFMLSLSLKALSLQFKIDKIRFWGKIFGTGANYYVAEAPYTEGILPDDQPKKMDEVATESSQEQKTEDKTPEEPATKKPDESEKLEESPETPESTGFKIPPIPVPKVKPVSRHSEKNGEGVNKYMYFVTDNPLHSWKCLPQLNSQHIVTARNLKRFFTGKLETEIRGCVDFEGTEAHYLRAQIARISASTYIAPNGYYRVKQKTIEPQDEEKQEQQTPPPEAVEDTEKPLTTEDEIKDIEENPEYKAISAKEQFNLGLEGLVHFRQAILQEGYCKWIAPESESKPEGTEHAEALTAPHPTPQEQTTEQGGESPQQPKEDEKEKPVPILRPLSEDKSDGLCTWMLRRSSNFSTESSVLLAKSNIWPGAYMYYDGKNIENIYIGDGYKYTIWHYAPKMTHQWQEEYPIDDSIMEPEEPREPSPVIEPAVENTETEGETAPTDENPEGSSETKVPVDQDADNKEPTKPAE